MSKIQKKMLLSAFEKRYDFQSARSVFQNAVAHAGLDDKGEYTADEVKNIAAAVPNIGDAVEPIVSALQKLTGGAPAAAKEPPKKQPPKKEPPKKEPPKKEAPKKEAPKAKKEEPKAEKKGKKKDKKKK